MPVCAEEIQELDHSVALTMIPMRINGGGQASSVSGTRKPVGCSASDWRRGGTGGGVPNSCRNHWT